MPRLPSPSGLPSPPLPSPRGRSIRSADPHSPSSHPPTDRRTRRLCFLPPGFALFVTLHPLFTFSLIFSLILPGAAMVSAYERPSGVATQSRSVVLARQGIVATSHPLAAQTGLDVLKAGGNAADAAVAAAAMIGVVEPMSCGIGGDLFLIYWDQKTQKLHGLDASGRSPRSLTREVFLQQNLEQIPVQGPLSWSVPGCVSGWSALQQRFGTRPFADNLAPAIATAEEGFPVSEIIAESWRQHEPQLRAWPDSAATYLIDGQRAPRFGEIFRNPRLAASYRQIARHGEAGFYQGEIARKIVAFSRANGGYLEEEDFARHEATWIEPVSTNYRGYDVWELPPAGQGISVLQMLNLMEPHDVASMGQGSTDFVHLFTEAKKLAFADRARFYADPSMVEVPTETLISKAYAAERAKRLSLEQAAADVPPGDPRLGHADTIYLTVVDKDRNCCSLIQSVYYNFGSQVTPGDVGFVMQNRGALFTLDEDHPNRLEPGKRPFHTIIPAMVTQDGKPWLCFGVMGGDMQPQGHVQVLCNLIDFGMNLQAAGDAARVRHDGSATPRGEPSQGVGTLFVEAGIPDSTVRELTERGHVVKRERGSYGGYQAIMLDHEQGVLHGASEVRKDGTAVGY